MPSVILRTNLSKKSNFRVIVSMIDQKNDVSLGHIPKSSFLKKVIIGILIILLSVLGGAVITFVAATVLDLIGEFSEGSLIFSQIQQLKILGITFFISFSICLISFFIVKLLVERYINRLESAVMENRMILKNQEEEVSLERIKKIDQSKAERKNLREEREKENKKKLSELGGGGFEMPRGD